MKVLVVGGTYFVGRNIVEKLIKYNHNVTLFNRGTQSVFSNLPKILGDRNTDGVQKLKGKKVKGKRVYFNASNIFSYHVSHATYTLDELITSYNKLHEILSNTESYYFRGSIPSKKWEYIYRERV